MPQSEFHELLNSLNALSPDQMRQLRRELDGKLAASSAESSGTAEQQDDQEVQRRLLAAGLVSEVKPPIVDPSGYRDRRAVPIQGEPLSETVLRDRR